MAKRLQERSTTFFNKQQDLYNFHHAGSEAAFHPTNDLFNDDSTDGILLVDAENGFNKMNRRVALHNIKIICPVVSTFAINIYRHANILFTTKCELAGEEGTTQGNPFAMIFYGLSMMILIYEHDTGAKVAWFADDSREVVW